MLRCLGPSLDKIFRIFTLYCVQMLCIWVNCLQIIKGKYTNRAYLQNTQKTRLKLKSQTLCNYFHFYCLYIPSRKRVNRHGKFKPIARFGLFYLIVINCLCTWSWYYQCCLTAWSKYQSCYCVIAYIYVNSVTVFPSVCKYLQLKSQFYIPL